MTFEVDHTSDGCIPPWEIPLHERVARLLRREAKVAYLYEDPDASTFRYRAFNMVDALEREPQMLSATWFFSAETDALSRVMSALDALVVCRYRYSYALDGVIGLARDHGVPVIYDLDDLVFDVDAVPLVMHTLDHRSDDVAVHGR